MSPTHSCYSLFVAAMFTVFNACSKSAMISLMCSMPTETWLHMRPCRTHAKDTHPNQIWGHPRRQLLLVRQLLVRRRVRVDDKCLGVTHVGEVARQLECVHRLARRALVALDAKAQHATVRVRPEQLLGAVVVGVALKAQVRHPCDFRVLYEPATGREYEQQDEGKGGP